MYKDWKDVKPYNYDKPELEKDYMDSCHILLWVMDQWFLLKREYADKINAAMSDPSNLVETEMTPEIKAKVDEYLKLFFHNGNK